MTYRELNFGDGHCTYLETFDDWAEEPSELNHLQACVTILISTDFKKFTVRNQLSSLSHVHGTIIR